MKIIKCIFLWITPVIWYKICEIYSKNLLSFIIICIISLFVGYFYACLIKTINYEDNK